MPRRQQLSAFGTRPLPPRSASAEVGLIGSGADQFVAQEAGSGKVGGLAAGWATKGTGGIFAKVGVATVGLVGTGAGASVVQEGGVGASVLYGKGTRAAMFSESGYATVGATGSGVAIKTGTGDALLLEGTSDKLLLEGTSDRLLLES